MKKMLTGAALSVLVSAQAFALGMPTGAVDPLVGVPAMIGKGIMLAGTAVVGIAAYRGVRVTAGSHGGGHTVGQTIGELGAGIAIIFGGWAFMNWYGASGF